MKNWKLILFSVCLTLMLSGTVCAADSVSLTLLFPDGTWLEQTVSCPGDAFLWYASYSGSGKMLESGRASVRDGKVEVRLTQTAESVKAFALDGDCKPLFGVAINGASAYQRGNESYWNGDYAGAIAAFTEAIEEDDNAPLAYVGRADAYIASGETAENLAAAGADYEAALALNETLSEAYLGLADVFIRQADYEQAIDILLRGANNARETQALAWKLNELDNGSIRDSAGNLRRDSGYNEDGELVWRHDYSYDEQGRPLSVTSYDADGNRTGHIDLEYNADGNPLVDFSFAYEDGILLRVINEYDDRGNHVKMSQYDADGALMFYNLFQYDEQGNEIRTDVYSRNEETGELELDSYFQFRYDGEGALIQNERHSANGDLLDYETREYNASGRIREYCAYSAESGEIELISRETYEYNWRGDCVITTVYDESGNVSFIDMNQYDDYGNLISVMRYDENGRLISVMRYDGRGNLMGSEFYDENGNLTDTDGSGNLTESAHMTKAEDFFPQAAFPRFFNKPRKIIAGG